MRLWLLLTIFAVFCTSVRAEFRFRITEDYGTVDWGYGEVNPIVVQQLMEGLTTSGVDGRAVPALAASWTGPNKKNEVQFHLRADAKWSDGKAVCAQHFIDAWQRVLSPQFASPYAHYLFDIAGARDFHAGKSSNVRGLVAKGCSTLIVTLERAVRYFPELASHWVLFPVRSDLIERAGPHWGSARALEHLAVTGPYVLREWHPDQEMVLAQNRQYYGRAPFEKTLRAVLVADDAVAVSLFQKGKLDWVKDLPFIDRARLARLPAYRSFPSFVEYHLGFQMTGDGAFSREQRCALALALNKDEIPGLLKGSEIPAYGVVHPAMLKTRALGKVNEARAKELWNRSGREVEAAYYSKEIHQPLMEWVQERWRTVLGARVKLRRLESKSYWNELSHEAPPVFLSGITAPYAHPYAFLSEFLSSSKANWGHFSSPEYDRLVTTLSARAVSATAPSIDAAQKLVIEDECAVVPLYFRETSSLLASGWDGLFVNPMTYVYLKNIRKK